MKKITALVLSLLICMTFITTSCNKTDTPELSTDSSAQETTEQQVEVRPLTDAEKKTIIVDAFSSLLSEFRNTETDDNIIEKAMNVVLQDQSEDPEKKLQVIKEGFAGPFQLKFAGFQNLGLPFSDVTYAVKDNTIMVKFDYDDGEILYYYVCVIPEELQAINESTTMTCYSFSNEDGEWSKQDLPIGWAYNEIVNSFAEYYNMSERSEMLETVQKMCVSAANTIPELTEDMLTESTDGYYAVSGTYLRDTIVSLVDTYFFSEFFTDYIGVEIDDVEIADPKEKEKLLSTFKAALPGILESLGLKVELHPGTEKINGIRITVDSNEDFANIADLPDAAIDFVYEILCDDSAEEVKKVNVSINMSGFESEEKVEFALLVDDSSFKMTADIKGDFEAVTYADLGNGEYERYTYRGNENYDFDLNLNLTEKAIKDGNIIEKAEFVCGRDNIEYYDSLGNKCDIASVPADAIIDENDEKVTFSATSRKENDGYVIDTKSFGLLSSEEIDFSFYIFPTSAPDFEPLPDEAIRNAVDVNDMND